MISLDEEMFAFRVEVYSAFSVLGGDVLLHSVAKGEGMAGDEAKPKCSSLSPRIAELPSLTASQSCDPWGVGQLREVRELWVVNDSGSSRVLPTLCCWIGMG